MRILEGVPRPLPGDRPDPGGKPESPAAPAPLVDFTAEPPGKPKLCLDCFLYINHAGINFHFKVRITEELTIDTLIHYNKAA